MKILTICPSIYPSKLELMEKSFYSTIKEYNKLLIINTGTVTEAINSAFNDNSNYDFYHITNDDVEYKKIGWDTILAQKNKVTYGNDVYQKQFLPTFPMIDGDIVRALGWLQLPNLERYCGDVVWKFIGDNLNILEYYPEVIIEHKWEGADEKINKEDMARFAQWLPWAFKDLEKIRKVLCTNIQ